MMKIKWIVLLFFLGMGKYAYSQDFSEYKSGIVVHNSQFKNFAVIMQDTAIEFFSNRFIKEYETNEYFQFLYIDNSLFYKCEQILLHPDSSIKFFYFSNQKYLKSFHEKIFRTFLNRYIRLYTGYINENNEKVICVQFVTPKEFIDRFPFYIYGLDLVEFDKTKLRFAYIHFKEE